MKPYIKINGVKLPAPSRGVNITRTPNIEIEENALGQTVAQKKGRSLISLKGLEWKYISAGVWEQILAEISKITGTLTFYNATTGMYDTYKVVWGTSTETPYKLDESGKPILYSSCKCEITDMGYDVVNSAASMED